MKAFIRKYKKRLIGIAILLIAYALFWRSSTKVAVPTEADTVAVTRGDIKSTLQVLGSTNLVTSQKLTFGAGWRVRKISVKQWDTVKKWQVLAEIDRRDAEIGEINEYQPIFQVEYEKYYPNDKAQKQNGRWLLRHEIREDQYIKRKYRRERIKEFLDL